MKLLRILTGVHAGAQLQLAPGTHRIGADDDADIRLTDWRGAHALLHVDASGVVSAQRVARDAQATPEEVVLLIDFAPMQFDETILCIGLEDAQWPSDLELLSMLLTRPAETRVVDEHKKRRRYVGAAVACCTIGAVIVAGSLMTTMQMSRGAALPNTAEERARSITAALAAAHVSGLRAQAQGGNVAVTGMLSNPNDDQTVRSILNRLSPAGVSRNYDVAQDQARSIEDALGVPGAHVRYLGAGEFAVAGTVKSLADLDIALARVRADLDSNVKTITVQATELSKSKEQQAAEAVAYSEMISSNGVRYAQTPDGVKHIYATDSAAAESHELESPAPPATETNANAHASARTTMNTVELATDIPSAKRYASGHDMDIDEGVPLPDPATLPASLHAGG